MDTSIFDLPSGNKDKGSVRKVTLGTDMFDLPTLDTQATEPEPRPVEQPPEEEQPIADSEELTRWVQGHRGATRRGLEMLSPSEQLRRFAEAGGGSADSRDGVGKAALEALLGNLDIPASFGGAAAGAAAGAPFGPAGMIGGGVLGGVFGTGVGSAASDLYAHGDINTSDVMKEMALSGAFDVATLGVGKVARPLINKIPNSERRYVPRTIDTDVPVQRDHLFMSDAGETTRAARDTGEKLSIDYSTYRGLDDLIPGGDPARSLAREAERQGADLLSRAEQGRRAAEAGVHGVNWDKATREELRRVLEATDSKVATDAELQSVRELLFPRAGSEQSLLDTQNILQRGVRDADGNTVSGTEATLTAAQTGRLNEKALQKHLEAEDSWMGRRFFEDNKDKASAVLADNLQRELDRGVDIALADNNTFGKALYDVIEAGRTKMYDNWEKGLADISQGVGKGVNVSTGRMRGAIGKFIADNRIAGSSVSKLDDAALKMAQKWDDTLKSMPNLPATDALELMKKFNADLRGLGAFGSAANNPVAANQLKGLRSSLSDALTKTFEKSRPRLAQRYKDMNKAYGQSKKDLMPEVNKSRLKAAGKGDFTSLANVVKNANPAQSAALMNSIKKATGSLTTDEAVGLASKLGLDGPTIAAVRENGGRALYDAMQERIGTRYLWNTIKRFDKDTFDPAYFSKIAKDFDNDMFRGSARALIGDSRMAHTKRLFNAFYDVSKRKGVMPPSRLSMGIADNMRTVARAGVHFAGMPAVMEMIPLVNRLMSGRGIAAASTNPKAVNKLLKMDSALRNLAEDAAKAEAAVTARNRAGLSSSLESLAFNADAILENAEDFLSTLPEDERLALFEEE